MDTTADASQGWMTSGPGAQRRILCQDKALMMVEFMFEKDGVGVPHSHPHVQTTFVSSGSIQFSHSMTCIFSQSRVMASVGSRLGNLHHSEVV